MIPPTYQLACQPLRRRLCWHTWIARAQVVARIAFIILICKSAPDETLGCWQIGLVREDFGMFWFDSWCIKLRNIVGSRVSWPSNKGKPTVESIVVCPQTRRSNGSSWLASQTIQQRPTSHLVSPVTSGPSALRTGCQNLRARGGWAGSPLQWWISLKDHVVQKLFEEIKAFERPL